MDQQSGRQSEGQKLMLSLMQRWAIRIYVVAVEVMKGGIQAS